MLYSNNLNNRFFRLHFLDKFESTIFIIIIFFLLKILSSLYFYSDSNINIFEISNLFSGYIVSLYNGEGFKSCIFDFHFTVYSGNEIGCSYATRMPLIPYLYSFLTFFSKNFLPIAIMKNLLISLLFYIFMKIFYNSLSEKEKKYFLYYNISLIIIFLSPSIIKHASSITYEEGIIIELLILWSLFFMQLVKSLKLQKNFNKQVLPISLLCLSTAIYFTKSSMLFCLIISYFVCVVWLFKNFQYKTFFSLILSLLLIFLWGINNLKKSDNFNIGSSVNWLLGYYGLNSISNQIYPEIALDQIWEAKKFTLKDGTIIVNNLEQVPKFNNEWEKNKFYKKKIYYWIKNNPKQFLNITLKKIYNFFINIKKTPYSIGPDVNMEYFKKPLQEIFVSSWLLFGRLCSIYFVYLIYKNWKKEKILCLFSLLILASYTAPHILGYNYERHVTPLFAIIIIINASLIKNLNNE
tara:strand:+ start:515 stop:1909 length:1395 start_codon:yes stop_codon:yes gene_type:complete